MRRDVLAVASALIDLGVRVGDHVVLLSENRLEWLYCDLGIQAAGAITVPIYANVTKEVAQQIAADCAAKLAIVSDQQEAEKLPIEGPLRTVALMDKDVAEWVARPPGQLAEISSRLANIRPDDVCTIVYTSGTTGEPKGAKLAHRNFVDISHAILKVHPFTENDSMLSFLPYSHIYERVNVFSGLMFGGQAWISRDPIIWPSSSARSGRPLSAASLAFTKRCMPP